MKTKTKFILSFSLIVLFVIFTISLFFVNIKPIGANNSSVAYAKINGYIHNLFGVHFVLYDITDWAGLGIVIFPLFFGFLGLIQLIKRKSLLKVDNDILLLGAFYIVVMGVYVIFEFIKINYRPILIKGILETSYPSSTTILTLCVMLTTILQIKYRLNTNKISTKVLLYLCYIFTTLMVVLRLISGVHWLTDIVGGVIISFGLVLLYSALVDYAKKLNNFTDKTSEYARKE